jgi:hypothetical protein
LVPEVQVEALQEFVAYVFGFCGGDNDKERHLRSKSKLLMDEAHPHELTPDDEIIITDETEENRHEFVGRLDRWCEKCNRPDRDSVHALTEEDGNELE